MSEMPENMGSHLFKANPHRWPHKLTNLSEERRASVVHKHLESLDSLTFD